MEYLSKTWRNNIWKKSAEHQWLIPIILATWEAEIGRIVVWGQLGKQFTRSHLQINQSKMDWSCGSKQ
jgi:hypothetical protein